MNNLLFLLFNTAMANIFFSIQSFKIKLISFRYGSLFEKSVISFFFLKRPFFYFKKLNKNFNFNKKTFFYFYKFFKNNYLIFIFFNNTKNIFYKFLLINFNFQQLFFVLRQKTKSLVIFKKTTGEGLFYIKNLFFIFFIDACLTDDEPLWEPVEWSLVQTWLLFIFIFAWIAENLITSRFGSFTGRDKRIWHAWYKTFWLIEFWYIVSYAAAALVVIVPFYYEITYSISFIFSWWHWYSRVFFFKFISIYTIIIMLGYLLLINLRWLNWKKLFFIVLLVNLFIAYNLYIHFLFAFFGYFNDPIWYQKTRFVDYIQLSHEPLKWGWGPSKRDHFTYHKATTVFWFKNDSPFAGAFLMFNLFFFLCFFFLYIYWIVLLRKTYTTKEISYTFTTYCVSSLKQFFLFYLLLYIFIFFSFILGYWRFPIEFIWITNSHSWLLNFFIIIKDLFTLLIQNFK